MAAGERITITVGLERRTVSVTGARRGPTGPAGPGGGGASVTVSATPPADPETGDQWFDTETGIVSTWNGSVWVADDPAGPSGSAAVGALATFMAVGDSITDRSSQYYSAFDYIAHDTSGWSAALMALSGNRLRSVPRANAFADDLEHAYTGISAAVYIAGGEAWLNGVVPVTDALAAMDAADIVIAHIGTNDIDGILTTAQIVAYIHAVWDAFVATGKPVIGTDLLSRTAAHAGWNSTLRDQLHAVNAELRATWQDHGLWTYRNWNELIEHDANGYAATTEMPNDGLHPTQRVGMRLGLDLWELLQPHTTGRAWSIPHRGSSSWVTPNPYVTGDVAGYATSWANNGVLNPVPSKVTDADGTEWQRLETSGAENTSGYRNFYCRITSGIPAAGTRVRACARIRTYDGTGITGAWVAVQQVGSPESTDWLYLLTPGGAQSVVSSPVRAGEILFTSEPFEIDAGVTQLWMSVGINSTAAGYIDFRQAGIYLDPE